MTWLTQHREHTIQHMLYLRERDQDYARWALKQYLASENCPCPDVGEEIRKRWNARNQNSVAG